MVVVGGDICSSDGLCDPSGPGDPAAASVRTFLHEKWQRKDGKHSGESAEVGSARDQDKSERALEAFGGWRAGGGGGRGGFQARLQPPWRDYIAQICRKWPSGGGRGCDRGLPDGRYEDKSMFHTCPAVTECFINASICLRSTPALMFTSWLCMAASLRSQHHSGVSLYQHLFPLNNSQPCARERNAAGAYGVDSEFPSCHRKTSL